MTPEEINPNILYNNKRGRPIDHEDLCNAVLSCRTLEEKELKTVLYNSSDILKDGVTTDAFYRFLLHNHKSVKALVSEAHEFYERLSDPLKNGFIQYLSFPPKKKTYRGTDETRWHIRLFIKDVNNELNLTPLSETLKNDRTYRDNINHKRNYIPSKRISSGAIDEYIKLLDNGIIRGIDTECVRWAIDKEPTDKLSVLKKYVKSGFTEKNAIAAINLLENETQKTILLHEFEEWVFERYMAMIPECSWDSLDLKNRFYRCVDFHHLSPDGAFLSILKRLLFWEQVRELSLPNSIIDSLDLDVRLKKSIRSLAEKGEFKYDYALKKLFIRIIGESRQAICLKDVISNYEIFGKQLQQAITSYCAENPDLVVDEDCFCAIVHQPELSDDTGIKRAVFNYLASNSDATLKLLKDYHAFKEEWKDCYLKAVRGHRYSPAQLVRSRFIEIVGADDFFQTKYKDGFNPNEDISEGTIEELATLYQNGIIKNRLYIIDRTCQEDNLAVFESLGWDNGTIRDILLSDRKNLSLLKDFEKMVRQSPLHEKDVDQFQSRCLYDEWLIVLTEVGHNEEFLINLIKNKNNNLFRYLEKHDIRNDDFRNALLHAAIEGIISEMRNNGIDYLYHFTDERNYQSIQTRGLISYQDVQRLQINFVPGGDDDSHARDIRNRGNEYIHLSLCPDSGMGFKRFQEATERGEKLLFFKIKLDVLHLLEEEPDSVKFSPGNAARRDITELLNLADFRVDYKACTTRLYNCDDEQKVKRQAEILVRSIPLDYIENINLPLRGSAIYTSSRDPYDNVIRPNWQPMATPVDLEDLFFLDNEVYR